MTIIQLKSVGRELPALTLVALITVPLLILTSFQYPTLASELYEYPNEPESGEFHPDPGGLYIYPQLNDRNPKHSNDPTPKETIRFLSLLDKWEAEQREKLEKLKNQNPKKEKIHEAEIPTVTPTPNYHEELHVEQNDDVVIKEKYVRSYNNL